MAMHRRARGRRHGRNRRGRCGFTLVEVLVALAVVALALGAMVRLMGDAAGNAQRLEQRTLGHWVAMNELALLEATGAWLDVGTTEGHGDLAGRRWHWRRTVSTTPDAGIRRVDLEISNEAGETVSSLVGFLGRGS